MRCVPTLHRCHQLDRCANACTSSRRIGERAIDASITVGALGFCPLFVDVRGAALHEQTEEPEARVVVLRRAGEWERPGAALYLRRAQPFDALGAAA